MLRRRGHFMYLEIARKKLPASPAPQLPWRLTLERRGEEAMCELMTMAPGEKKANHTLQSKALLRQRRLPKY